MFVPKDVLNLVQDNHHSQEQFPALFRVLAHGQIVRHHFELGCQTPKPLRSARHGSQINTDVNEQCIGGSL